MGSGSVHLWLYRMALITLILLATFLLYYYVGPAMLGVIDYLVPVFLPFIIAFILAAIIDPMVRYLQRRGKISRPIAVISTMLFFLLVIATITVGIISRLIIELERLSKTLPQYSTIFNAEVRLMQQKLQNWYVGISLPQQIITRLQGTVDSLIETASKAASYTIDILLTMLAGVPSGLLITVIALLATYFFSRDKELIISSLFQILPQRWEERFASIVAALEEALVGFLRAQLFLIVVTAAQSIIFLNLMGIDYALTMGVVVGLVDILPVLGPGAVFIPWIIIEFILGKKKLSLLLLLLYGSVVVVRQLLQPKVIGEQVGIHPLSALVAMYVGLKVLGVLGLVIGPMLLVLFKALSKSGLFSRWIG